MLDVALLTKQGIAFVSMKPETLMELKREIAKCNPGEEITVSLEVDGVRKYTVLARNILVKYGVKKDG